MRLTGRVRHIRRHNEVIEQRTLAFRQYHRHIHRESTVVASHRLTTAYLLVITGEAYRTRIPVAVIVPPPEGQAAHHLIFHGSALHGHTGIAAGRRLDGHRIASLIVRLYLIEFHFEGGALVFLHTDTLSLSVHHQ